MSGPTQRALGLWRIYWFGLVVLWIWQLGNVVTEFEWSKALAELRIGSSVLLILLLILLLVWSLLPLIAHYGYAWSQPFRPRWLWRIVFVLDVCALGVQVIAALLFGTLGTLSDSLLSIAWLLQTYVLWVYSYRSPHIWAQMPEPPSGQLPVIAV